MAAPRPVDVTVWVEICWVNEPNLAAPEPRRVGHCSIHRTDIARHRPARRLPAPPLDHHSRPTVSPGGVHFGSGRQSIAAPIRYGDGIGICSSHGIRPFSQIVAGIRPDQHPRLWMDSPNSVLDMDRGNHPALHGPRHQAGPPLGGYTDLAACLGCSIRSRLRQRRSALAADAGNCRILCLCILGDKTNQKGSSPGPANRMSPPVWGAQFVQRSGFGPRQSPIAPPPAPNAPAPPLGSPAGVPSQQRLTAMTPGRLQSHGGKFIQTGK